jgi:diguanylate cyclase (GGDEF)-like protein
MPPRIARTVLRYLLALAFTGSALAASAPQMDPLPVQRLPVNGALTQNSITDMLQDRSGLMWFATLAGVNVYDGYQFRAITSDPRDPNSLSGVTVSKLFEDRDGYIWVAGFFGWLDRIDPRTGEVRHFSRELYGRADRPALFYYTGMHQGPDGMLWFATSGGLHRFDPAHDKLDLHVDAVKGRAPLANLRAVAPAANGKLWLGGQDGLYRFDPRSGALEHFVHDPKDPLSLTGGTVTTFHLDPYGTLWIGSEQGLNRWNGDGRGFTRFVHDSAKPGSLGGNLVQDLLTDRHGRLWVACLNGGGLNLYRNGRFEVFRNDPDNPGSLSSDDIWSLLEDRSGLFWVGTAGLGLNQLNPSTRRFRALTSIPFNRNSLRSSFVWDIQEGPDQKIWLATLAGIESYDPQTARYAQFAPSPANVASNQMQSLTIDSAGRFWVGSVDGRLYRFHPESNRFVTVRHPDRTDDRFSLDRIWYFGEGPDGRIWVSTLGELVALDPESATVVERIPASERVPLGTTAGIRASLVDSDGVLWFGGGGAGLIRYEPGKGLTAILSHDSNDPTSLSDNVVRSLYESPDGTLWVGTLNGLNQMQAADRRAGRNRFSLYTTSEGLPNNTIYGILPDSAGRLWLSTNRGLSLFDPKTRRVRNFDSRDGLIGDEMNGGAELVASDGTYYFGAVNGVNWFRPNEIPHNTYVPQVRLSNVEVAGKSVGDGFLPSRERLEIEENESDISLAFATMDFHQPEKNRFRYRLGGKSDAWVETDSNSVNLAKLSPGDYRFEVFGSNNDGVWSAQPAYLDIVVHPPIWRTSAAYAFYGLLIAGLLVFYDRSHRLKLAREREFNENLASAHSLAEANHQLALRNAQFDSLTQLPNRASLMDAIGRYMRFARSQQREIALLLINLDRFQRINDTIGHHLGDLVLKVTAERLSQANGSDDLLARVGSDEFALIAIRPNAVDGKTWLDSITVRVLEAIALPHEHHDPPLSMTASIGVAVYDGNDDTASELLGFANIALHAAKRAGGNGVQRYVPGMIESARERLSIERRMHIALEAHEFLPYYQPLIDVRGRNLAGFEALIRWQPPGQSMIFPDQFIPVAEESGLIVDLGNLMIREVCRQLALWKRWDIQIAVNVSMRQLRSGLLVGTIRSALLETGIPAECLKLEITESAMMENVEDTAEQLREIKKLGVGLSVDDFGTGFSSLSHLKMLPVDEMKIDRSFISDVATNRHSQKIVNSIVRLAHELQLNVVAEGVEEENAMVYLRAVGCDLAQGYLFDRPRPAVQIVERGWLEPGATSARERLSVG